MAQSSLLPFEFAVPVYHNVMMNKNIPFKNTSDIKGNPITLLLDEYEPSSNSNYKRPLLVFIHGGGMIGGFRDDDQALKICNAFAMRGYVCASIDYRIGIDSPAMAPEYLTAVYKAVQDARCAISFLKIHAADFCIDTSMIFISGTSAGSVVALYTSYWDQEEVPDTINVSQLGLLNDGISFTNSEIKCCVNNWGAVSDTGIFENEKIPIINIANTGDPVVPFSIGLYDGKFYLFGSAVINRVAKRLHINSSLYPFNISGHGINPNSAREDTVIWLMSEFLYSNLAANVATQNCNELNFILYPNPCAEALQIKNTSTLLAFNGTIRIINSIGELVLSQNAMIYPDENISINIAGLNSGIYCAEIISTEKFTALKFIVQHL